MKAPCGQEDCDCGHTIERLETERDHTIQRGVRAMHGVRPYFRAYQLWRNVAMRRQADSDRVHIEACKERDRLKKALERIEAMTTDYVGTSQAAGDIAKVAHDAIKEAKS